MRTLILHIFIFISSLTSAQVDTFSLDNIPTKKCRTTKFPVTWDPIDFTPPQQKLKSTLSDIRPEAYHSLQTIYLGQPEFEEIFPEDVITKVISRSHVKDIAKLDIQYLDKKHGLPGSSIYTMETDTEGNILFSTYGTLNRYDGTELTSYYFNDSIGDIRHISATGPAKKWISTTSGVLYQEGESFYALKNNWGLHFWRARMDQEDVLWMTSYGEGIYFIKNDSLFQLINDEIKIDSKEIIRDQKGQVWVACLPGVIRMTARDTVLYRFERNGKQASSIIEFEDKIYVGQFRKGLRAIKEDEVWDLELGIDDNSPYDFEITDKGLWFTVYGVGLQLLESDGSIHKFEQNDGLVQRTAHTLTSDGFGNIWVGDLFKGISIFSEAHFRPGKSLYRPTLITDIDEVQDTSWFFYHWGTPIRKIGNTFFDFIFSPDFAERIYIQDGFVLNGDKAWFQCYDYGYVEYEKGIITTYEYSVDPQETLNHQVSIDRFGRVWAINLKSELRYLSGDTIHLCYQQKSESASIFQNIKYLIIDTDQELYYNNSFEVYWVQKDNIFRRGFDKETIKFIFKHPQRGLWVVTDRQLHHLVKDKIVNSYAFELPKHCTVNSGLNVSNSIYLTTSEGFFEIKLNQDKLTFEKAFSNADFSRTHLFYYQNELMLSGDEYNHIYNSWWNLKKDYLPKLSIRDISISGVKKSPATEIGLKPDEHLVVDLNHQDWGKNSQLQYQLIKDDNALEWSVLNENRLTFDNLSSGNYQLEVRARNQSNKWVTAGLPFTVAPFWYESQWFFLLLIAFLLVAFYYIYQYRVNRAKAMELQLNQAVDAKTKELAEEKKQVEKQLQQKKLLLKEVNHRVMNNMQMVSSILELQNRKTTHPDSKENFKKATDRIKALALAHQHLYKYEEYETINLKEYLSVIEKSLKLDKDIHTTLKIDPTLNIPIERAQSLGLLLNELISNSIKHAWTSNDLSKQIDIQMAESDTEYHWTYADNGQGIKANGINNQGLGRTLIHAIAARQLSGSLEYLTHDGFKLIIKFPKS